MLKKIILFAAVALIAAVNINALSGRDIMIKVDERDDGDTRKSFLSITLINKRGSIRVRNVISYSKDYGKDSKKIMYFTKPEDVEGTCFLSWEYDDVSKEDDKWLYMPALRKERRISGKSSNDYFMGTDFTYDDMGDRNVDEDNHTLKGEDVFSGKSCWLIESVPVEAGEYTYKKVWVCKETCMVIHVEYYNRVGLLKVLTCGKIDKIDGIWTACEMVMENKQENHKTVMEFSEISYNKPVKDSLFSVASIKKGRIR